MRRPCVGCSSQVAKNSTDLVVADIMAALWDNYRVKPGSAAAAAAGNSCLHHHYTSTLSAGSGGGLRSSPPSLAYLGDAADLALDPVDIL